MIAVINFWFKSLYSPPTHRCYYLRAQNSRLTWRPSHSKALVEKTAKWWGIHFYVEILPGFRGDFSLCLTIRIKLIEQITYRINFPFHLSSTSLIILVIWAGSFWKRWLYTTVGQPQKRNFCIKKRILVWKSMSGTGAFQSICKF